MKRLSKMGRFSSLLGLTILACLMCLFLSTKAYAASSSLTDLKVYGVLSDGNLEELTLTPEFSSDVLKYEAIAPYGTTKIQIKGTTEEANATTVENWTDMDPGDNTSWLRVTATDGTHTDYYVYTHVMLEGETTTPSEEETEEESTAEGESPAEGETQAAVTPGSLDVIINGKEMTVAATIPETASIPNGFTKESYDFEGVTVECIKSTDTKMVALYAEGSNRGYFYAYNSTDQVFSKLLTSSVVEGRYTFGDVGTKTDMPSSYLPTDIKIRRATIRAYTLGKGSSYYLVYAVDSEGTTALYSYNAADNTLQLFNTIDYNDSVGVASNENYDALQATYDKYKAKTDKNLMKLYKIIVIIGLGLLVFLFVTLHLILKIKEYNSAEYEGLYTADTALEDRRRKKEEKAAKRAAKREKKRAKYEDYEEDGFFDDDYDYEETTDGEYDEFDEDYSKPIQEEDEEYDDIFGNDSEDELDIGSILAEANGVKEEEDSEIPDMDMTQRNLSPSEKAQKEKEDTTSIKDIMAAAKQASPAEAKASPKTDEDIFADLNIDLTDSILAELSAQSAKINAEQGSGDIELPDLETGMLPKLDQYDKGSLDDDFDFYK